MRASIPALSGCRHTTISQATLCLHHKSARLRRSQYTHIAVSSNNSCSNQLPRLLQLQSTPARSQARSIQCAAGFGFGASSESASKSKACPCGSGKQYADCCQRFIKPQKKSIVPNTPEQLISARYSAFCEKDVKFLKRTNHRNNPALQGSKTSDDAGVQKRCTYEEDLAMTLVAVDFVNFKILSSSSSSSSSSSNATVDYTVTFRRKIDSQGQKITEQQEETLFERATVVRDDDGRWLVLQVEQIQPEAAAAAAAVAANY